MATIYKLQAKIPWKTYRDRKSGEWIGVCDALRVTALGDSENDLHEAISDVLDTLFRDLLSDGELDHFLRSHGWQFEGSPPLDLIDEETQFVVPIELIAAEAAEARAGA